MQLRFVKKFTENANAVSFIFTPERRVEWQAGQYLTLTMPGVPFGSNERTFTISAAPYETHIQVTTRVTPSAFKQRLNMLVPGDTVEADQFGGDFVWEDRAEPIIFLAGGIGITPFHSIIKQRHHENKPLNVKLIYANRDENIVFKAELDAIAKIHPEFGIHYVIGEQLDATKLQAYAPELKKSYVYISGPEPMVDAYEKMLLEHGLQPEQLKEDWFPGYTQKNY